MSTEEIGKIVGIASTIGALVGGLMSFLINWWWKFRAERDRIQVRCGPAYYEETPATSLHVINRSEHKVEVTSYGFVLRDGLLLSIPIHWANCVGDDDSEDLISGTTVLASRNDRYEVHVRLYNKDVIGAFARTAAQHRMRYDFNVYDPIPLWTQWLIRMKHWRRPQYSN